MTSLFKKQRPSTTLGITFDGNRLEVVALKRTNGSFQVQKTLSTPLALSPLTGDPELVGREIRNHLDAAGIRERRCVVGLPLNWVLILNTPIPEMPEEDVTSFLELEAERGFPNGPETLWIVPSRCRNGNEQFATQIAVPRANVTALENALKAAKLKPASFTLAISALENPESKTAEGVLALSVGTSSVDLQLSCGGGISTLRFLEGAGEESGVAKRLEADVVAREIRISLGQLPSAIQGAVRQLNVYGRGEMAKRFASEITPRAKAMGLNVELIERCSPGHFENVGPTDTQLSPALALAAAYLAGNGSKLEFLPPKAHPWKDLVSNKFSSKKLGAAAAVAGVVALGVCGAFAYQQIQISQLESQWKTMSPAVHDLEAAQGNIRKFRPWFDESYRSLAIMRCLTEAFPEDGSVSAKTLEIRDPAKVTCSGVAHDNQSFLKLLDKVRGSKGVTGVTVDQLRGQSPIQYSFSFQWEGEKANAN